MAKACGHPDLIFHDLRRTAACKMADAGIPERTIMKIAGWKSEKMLRRYLKARQQKDVAEAFHAMNQARKTVSIAHNLATKWQKEDTAQAPILEQ